MRPVKKSVSILGVRFAAVSFRGAVARLAAYVRKNAAVPNRVIVTPNPEGVMLARRNPAFARAVGLANARLADGTGIWLAAWLQGTPLPGRVRGLDVTYALFERLSRQGAFTAYFLGGKPGVAEAAKTRMEEKFPNLRVAGTQHGFFDLDSPEEEAVLADIRQAAPDILLVCMGMPRAEIWAVTHRNLPARITLCVGGTLDIMAGTATLAPAWLRAIGLEWLYRLKKQPERWRRMVDIPRFMWAVWVDRFGGGHA